MGGTAKDMGGKGKKRKQQQQQQIQKQRKDQATQKSQVQAAECSVYGCPHVKKAVQFNNIRGSIRSSSSVVCKDCTLLSNPPKHEDEEVCICLNCGRMVCARATEHQHGVKHQSANKSHALVVNAATFQVWCYECDRAVIPEQETTLFGCLTHIKRCLSSDAAMEEEQVLMSSKKTVVPSKGMPGIPVRGLVNQGNTCFFNSVVQGLNQATQLHGRLERLLTVGSEVTVRAQDQESLVVALDAGPGVLTKAMRSLFTEFRVEGRGSIMPRMVFNHIAKVAPRFGSMQQQDSQELLRCLLDSLRTEEGKRVKGGVLKALKLKSVSPSSITEHQKATVRAYGRSIDHSSFVDEIFGGQIVSSVTCLECSTVSSTYEHFLDLSLPLPDEVPIRGNSFAAGTAHVVQQPHRSSGKKTHQSDVIEQLVSHVEPRKPSISKHQAKKDARKQKKEAKKKSKQKSGQSQDGSMSGVSTSASQEECAVPSGKDEPSDAPAAGENGAGGTDAASSVGDAAVLDNWEDVADGTDAAGVSAGSIEVQKAQAADDSSVPQHQADADCECEKAPVESSPVLGTGQESAETVGENSPHANAASAGPLGSTANLTPDADLSLFDSSSDEQESKPDGGALQDGVQALGIAVGSSPGDCHAQPTGQLSDANAGDSESATADTTLVMDETPAIANEPGSPETLAASTSDTTAASEVVDDSGNADATRDDSTDGVAAKPVASAASAVKNALGLEDFGTVTPMAVSGLQDWTLAGSLSRFVNAEVLDGANKFGCDKCTKHRRQRMLSSGEIQGTDDKVTTVKTLATKQLLLRSLPPVLTLHLKRFKHTGYMRAQKISKHLAFPLLLDMSPFCSDSADVACDGDGRVMYSLFAVTEHSGSMKGGHYTAYVKSRLPLDDTTVSAERTVEPAKPEVLPEGSCGVPVDSQTSSDHVPTDNQKPMDTSVCDKPSTGKNDFIDAQNVSENAIDGQNASKSEAAGGQVGSEEAQLQEHAETVTSKPDAVHNGPLSPAQSCMAPEEQAVNENLVQKPTGTPGIDTPPPSPESPSACADSDHRPSTCSPPAGSWFYVSDAHVSSASEQQVLNSQAYILFYERLPVR